MESKKRGAKKYFFAPLFEDLIYFTSLLFFTRLLITP